MNEQLDYRIVHLEKQIVLRCNRLSRVLKLRLCRSIRNVPPLLTV